MDAPSAHLLRSSNSSMVVGGGCIATLPCDDGSSLSVLPWCCFIAGDVALAGGQDTGACFGAFGTTLGDEMVAPMVVAVARLLLGGCGGAGLRLWQRAGGVEGEWRVWGLATSL